MAGVKDKIEECVSSEGGPKHPVADSQRQKQMDPSKMENELELRKDSKQTDKMNEPSDVAGRHDKGMAFTDKLVPGGSG
ncbi:uncharacterized protein PV09_08181 [Verruconis gallopava]|uniref:Uncharacterized protein n=1 Tax=Verruconis gallopava TaxID=253628 RepID=A0A0D1XDI1_9PEZI|nr:uncharacterized protein PV09_08181 [Verruconis gallopava]KIW00291.1 hypothetical protein PV09_08181 [Verruconis gallopava]